MRSIARSAASSSMPRANVAAARDAARRPASPPRPETRAARRPSRVRARRAVPRRPRGPRARAAARRGGRCTRPASARTCASDGRTARDALRCCCSLAGDASMPSAYRRRKSARSSSCDLMPSRASRYGWKRGSIAARSDDAAPHLPQARQHRAVALIQRRVRLLAEPLDAFGVAPGPGAWRPARRPPRPMRTPRDRARRAGTPRAPDARRARTTARRARASASPLARHRSNSSATGSVKRPSPPKLSTTSRCVAGSSSVWCSCCP